MVGSCIDSPICVRSFCPTVYQGTVATAHVTDHSCRGMCRYNTSVLPERIDNKIQDPMKLNADSVDDTIVVCTNVVDDECICTMACILDSGASDHVFPTNTYFSAFAPDRRGARIETAESNRSMKILGTGTLNLIGEVVYCPELSQGVISISKLDKQGYQTSFHGGKCEIRDASGYLLMRGSLGKDGLYWVDRLFVKMMCEDSDSSPYRNHLPDAYDADPSDVELNSTVTYWGVEPESPEQENSNCISCSPNLSQNLSHTCRCHKANIKRKRYISSGENLLCEIHRRWGHLSESRIKEGIRRGIIDTTVSYESIKDLSLPLCIDCQRGRMKAFPSQMTSRKHHWKPFEKVALDYKGPFSVKGLNGYIGFFYFSDAATHYCWLYLVKSKDELSEAIKEFKANVINKSNYTWRVMQCDYEKVNLSKQVRTTLADMDITIQASAPYRKDQNGQVERDIASLMDKARTFMESQSVPSSYWQFAVKTACWFNNRSPTSSETFKTPLELAFARKPNLDDMIPFYCLGVYHLSDEERGSNSMNPKAEVCRFLGYEEDLRNDDHLFIILDVTYLQVLRRHDVIFDSRIVEQEMQTRTTKNVGFDVDNSVVHAYNQDERISTPEIIQAERMQLRSDTRAQLKVSQLRPIIKPGSNSNSYYSNSSISTVDDSVSHTGAFSQSSKKRKRIKRKNLYLAKLKSVFEQGDIEDDSWSRDDFSNLLFLNKTSSVPLESDEKIVFSVIINDDIKCCQTIVQSPTIIGLPPAPKSVKEALESPESELWLDAIAKELDTLESYGTFAEAPNEGRAMKMKLVLTLTYKNDYSLKYKARLVVCGYSQVKGLDYDQTFSPTTAISIVFLMLCIAGSEKWTVGGFDVTAAFLEGWNDFVQYCRLPQELGGTRYRIVKSLYGEKQAPKIWYERLHEILTTMGFERCPLEPCLYMTSVGERGTSSYSFVILTIHVDDGLLVASSKAQIDTFMEIFNTHIKKSELFEKVEKYLGLDITYGDDGEVLLNQSTYITGKLDIPMSSKPCKVPMANTINLRREETNPMNDSLLPVIGKLRYLADRSRPNILASLGELSVGGHKNPSDMHVKVSKSIVRYIHDTSALKLKLGGKGKLFLFGFSDASFISEGDSLSRFGGAIFYGEDSGAVYTFSKRSEETDHSVFGSEIRALDVVARSIVYYRDVLEFLGRPEEEPSTIYVDNKSMAEVMLTLKSGHKTKHLNLMINYIRQLVNKRIIKIQFIRTHQNVADLFTKPLAFPLFEPHRDKVMNGFGGKFIIDEEPPEVKVNMVIDHNSFLEPNPEGDDCF
jgi:hypothetical protein